MCRKRNDVSPTQHEFLLQGQEKIYIIHFPMFHLEKHRHQLIIEVELPSDAKEKYIQAKKADPSTIFTVNTTEALALADLTAGKKKTFKAIIKSRSPKEYEKPFFMNP